MSANPIHPQMHELVDAAAQGLGLATVRVVASAPDDLEQAFQKLTHEKCDAIG
jgi:hypothetical protein